MIRISATIFLLFIGLPHILKSQTSNFFDYLDFRITPLASVNTNESDISPFFVDNELFFSSIRDEFIGDAQRQEQNALFYDIYRSEIDEKGNPVTERQLVPGFGNLYHEGPAAWCKKTGEMFVTMSDISIGSRRRSAKQRAVTLGLRIMKKIDGEWVVTFDFPFNSHDYNLAHPAINQSGDTLVFSSDMDGGFGNSDLYMSVRKEGQWSTPVNLGDKINTPGNEMFPTFGPDGMLLFSSDGRLTNYGRLDIYHTIFLSENEPANLGEKINSSDDDFGLAIHPSGKFGYFSSNRYSWKKDDIFLVEFFRSMENIRGKVIADHNEEAVQDAIVYLEDCDGNQIKSVLSGYFGNFEFEVPRGGCYQIRADKEGSESELVSASGNEFVELRLKRIISYQLTVTDFESGNALDDAQMSCGEMQWRSDAAGEINIKFDSIFDCRVQVSKAGYFDDTFNLDPGRFVSGTETTDTVRLFKKEIGRKFLMKSIDYYIDMWRLMPRSEPELDQLVKLMEDNPTLRIEISAHTDSRMEDQYNMWLSQKRADSVAEYLVQKGIAKERIVAKGYGETRLLNHCANGVICTEKQHLVNRRTEFVILKY
ncbi:OmpA family protein [Mariniphaga anaerophila]|nr:OmpA family protein [Mariniphaga anaerophila]